VRVKPGERIGLDGDVTAGTSTIDQAPITGESLPVEKPWAIRSSPAPSTRPAPWNTASRRRRTTTLARIIHAVEQAQGARAPTQRFVDSFSKLYTPAVFLLALAVASSRRCSWPAPGSTGSTAPWCCWWSPAPAPW
jgi:Cd2+/Zn2+-exporting ATPase